MHAKSTRPSAKREVQKERSAKRDVQKFRSVNTADDIITSLEIIEKLLFPETDFWRNNYLKLA